MLRYPSDLDGSHHYVTFTALNPNGTGIGEVALYCPPGISFSDSAAYNQFDMGVLGASNYQSAINEGMSGEGGAGDAIRSVAAAAKADVTGSPALKNIISAQVLQNAGMGSGLVEKAKDIYLYNSKKAINPNSVTQFTNTAIRNYNFTFKMMASNESESNTIKAIVEFFQDNMYPGSSADGLLLEYPSRFRVEFMRPGGSKNTQIPGIYTSYLINLTTAYNASTNMFFESGAPSEVDITIGFQETKALTRTDIQELRRG